MINKKEDLTWELYAQHDRKKGSSDHPLTDAELASHAELTSEIDHGHTREVSFHFSSFHLPPLSPSPLPSPLLPSSLLPFLLSYLFIPLLILFIYFTTHIFLFNFY